MSKHERKTHASSWLGAQCEESVKLDKHRHLSRVIADVTCRTCQFQYVLLMAKTAKAKLHVCGVSPVAELTLPERMAVISAFRDDARYRIMVDRFFLNYQPVTSVTDGGVKRG